MHEHTWQHTGLTSWHQRYRCSGCHVGVVIGSSDHDPSGQLLIHIDHEPAATPVTEDDAHDLVKRVYGHDAPVMMARR